jgi:hypothetical protein
MKLNIASTAAFREISCTEKLHMHQLTETKNGEPHK